MENFLLFTRLSNLMLMQMKMIKILTVAGMKNAGISESVENGFLSIQLFTFKDDVLIKVYNTGPLFSHQVIEKIHSVSQTSFSDQKSIGLINIQMRLRSQFGNSYGLLLENMEDRTSVCVTIRIPQIHQREDLTK